MQRQRYRQDKENTKMKITRVKVWTKKWTKQNLNEVRIYIDYVDDSGTRRQGCWYKTGNPYEESRLDNLGDQVLAEAKRLAVWDGYWHTLYEEDCQRRYAELEPQPEPEPQSRPEPKPQPEPQQPGRKMSDFRRFSHDRHAPGEAWQARDDSWWIVTSVERVTMDNGDQGYAHTVRPAQPDEIPGPADPEAEKSMLFEFFASIDD
ncbi:MAG: hypothetical protein D6800_08690 [Candidatus Zixiibacteriota bacterium]|nr:MAG: hypothetical protein D6800_08690 [candidate division Zixibacteria bacterium]